nr:MAG TPA: hypothetical protein [Caudoviricetes sp.]
MKICLLCGIIQLSVKEVCYKKLKIILDKLAKVWYNAGVRR